ncbi:MAG: helix-turn-helix transcriptional regulator [Coriobacteriia bacterium]|nr:helix-turn-helix transcriptional regulator [Coriobacteriia bacterium]
MRREKHRPVYMIGIAAELAGVHPQTLRIYERKQLVEPKRTGGNTRLYSDADIERLKLIQELTQEEGINLAGVVRIIELEEERDRLQDELEILREEIREMKREAIKAELLAVRSKAIVPLGNVAVTRIERT